MNRTRKNLLALHSDIAAYAAGKLADYGLPRCDLGDIISAAYLRAQAKIRRHRAKKNRRELFKSVAFSEVMDELRKRGTVRRLHDKYALRLDADKRPSDGECGEDVENDGIAISDEGSGAAAIRAFDVPREPETPDWVYAVRERYARERGMPRKILDRFKNAWEHEEVRLDLLLPKADFYKILKKLQVRFDQCFQGYHAWLARFLMRGA